MFKWIEKGAELALLNKLSMNTSAVSDPNGTLICEQANAHKTITSLSRIWSKQLLMYNWIHITKLSMWYFGVKFPKKYCAPRQKGAQKIIFSFHSMKNQHMTYDWLIWLAQYFLHFSKWLAYGTEGDGQTE